jgi:hypothetical protein
VFVQSRSYSRRTAIYYGRGLRAINPGLGSIPTARARTAARLSRASRTGPGPLPEEQNVGFNVVYPLLFAARL